MHTNWCVLIYRYLISMEIGKLNFLGVIICLFNKEWKFRGEKIASSLIFVNFFFQFCRFLQKFTCAVARRLKRNARLEANFYPVTTSIFIQEWSSLPDERAERVQRELSILTDRSQAGASLAEGEVCTYYEIKPFMKSHT